MTAAAWAIFSAASYSPCALTTLARRSRSASACLAIARFMLSGSATSLTSTAVNDFLQFGVDTIALGKEIIERRLAEHAAEGGLGDERGGFPEIFHLNDGI